MTTDDFFSEYSKALVQFRHVYEYKSLAAAAVPSGVTDSHLSRTITKLETSLGSVLFHRTKTGCTPTDAAKKLYEFLIEAEAAFEKRFPSNFDFKTAKFTVTIGANSYSRATVFPQLISQLYAICRNANFVLIPIEDSNVPENCEIVLSSSPLGDQFKHSLAFKDKLVLLADVIASPRSLALGPDEYLNDILYQHYNPALPSIKTSCYYSLLDTAANASVAAVVPSALVDDHTRINNLPVTKQPIDGSYTLFFNVRKNVADHPKIRPIIAFIDNLRYEREFIGQ